MTSKSSKIRSNRLVRIPDEFEQHKACLHVTGLIVQIEEDTPDYIWDDVAAILEEHRFEPVEFVLGSALG